MPPTDRSSSIRYRSSSMVPELISDCPATCRVYVVPADGARITPGRLSGSLDTDPKYLVRLGVGEAADAAHGAGQVAARLDVELGQLRAVAGDRLHLGVDVAADVGEALAEPARLRVHLRARHEGEKVAGGAAQRRHGGAVDQAMVPVQVVVRVGDDEVGPEVGDQRVEAADQLVHRDVLDPAGALRYEDHQPRAELLRPRLSLGEPLLDAVGDRDDGHRHLGALVGEPGQEAAGADLEVVRVGPERDDAARFSFVEDTVHRITSSPRSGGRWE